MAYYFSESWRLIRKLIQSVLLRLGFNLTGRTVVFLKQDMAAMVLGDVSKPALHPISAADVQAEPLFCYGVYSREQILDRLAQGHKLFAIKHADMNACFGWIEQGRTEVKPLRFRFDIPPDIRYLAGLYTLPAMRGRGLALQMWLALGQRCKDQGAKHLLAVVNLQNIPSRQLHRKLGFLEYQIVHFKQFGFFNYYRVQDTQSPLYRRWMTLFNSPPELWKTFWSGDKTESGKKITVVTSEKAV